MKKPSIIYLLIISCIVFVFTNTYLVFNYISKTDAEIQQIDKISRSVLLSSTLLSLIKDTEIGQRGYVITQDPNYLAPYIYAKQNLSERKEEYYKSTVGLNYISKETLIKIDTLIDQKIQETDRTINLIKLNRIDEALTVIRTNQGKILMDSIRVELNNVRYTTERYINSLKIKLEENRSDLKYFIYVFNFLIIGTLITFTLRLRNRDLKIANLIKSVTHQKNEVNLLAYDLQEQNEKLLKYSHILSHDLKAPIQNFKGLVSLYENEQNETEKKSLFEMLKKQCDNLSSKVFDLVDELKNIQYKKEELQQFDLQLLIDKVLVQFQQEIYASKAHISLSIEKNLMIEGTSTSLESIFQNLLSNALKYKSTDKECFVEIKGNILEDKVKVSIEDNGVGIDLKKHGNQIFQIYQTFHDHPDAKGVGLHLVKKLVNNLNGEITLESVVNKGSKFILTFPKI